MLDRDRRQSIASRHKTLRQSTLELLHTTFYVPPSTNNTSPRCSGFLSKQIRMHRGECLSAAIGLPHVPGEGNGKPGRHGGELLEGNRGACLLELLLESLGLCLCDALLDRLRGALDEVLCLLESQSGDLADSLD